MGSIVKIIFLCYNSSVLFNNFMFMGEIANENEPVDYDYSKYLPAFSAMKIVYSDEDLLEEERRIQEGILLFLDRRIMGEETDFPPGSKELLLELVLNTPMLERLLQDEKRGSTLKGILELLLVNKDFWKTKSEKLNIPYEIKYCKRITKWRELLCVEGNQIENAMKEAQQEIEAEKDEALKKEKKAAEFRRKEKEMMEKIQRGYMTQADLAREKHPNKGRGPSQ